MATAVTPPPATSQTTLEVDAAPCNLARQTSNSLTRPLVSRANPSILFSCSRVATISPRI